MDDTTSPTREILVVGAGMAAHRFVDGLLRDPGAGVRVTVIGDERHGPYDRSALIGVLSGTDAEDLQLDPSVFRDDRVRLIRDDRVLRIDPARRTVRTRSRRTYSYDMLVLATGSVGARVVVEGASLPGCFALRTIDDAESVRAFVDTRSRVLGRPLRGAVIGGGMPGLRTAVALQGMGVRTTVVQYPDRLMPEQLDQHGSGIVQDALEEQGIAVRTRTRTTRLDPDDSGAVTALEFQDGSFQRVDVVIFTVGVRPRDELARNAGLAVHPRGGVIIDERCQTSDPSILAIGAAACFDGRCIDAADTAQAMAEVAAVRLLGGEVRLPGQNASTHLTVAGIDLASFGDPSARGAGVIEVVTRRERAAGVYRKLVLTDDARALVGGVLVGDTRRFDPLRRLVGAEASIDLATELRSAGTEPEGTAVCVHIGMTHRELRAAVRDDDLSTFSAIGARFGRDHDCERCTLATARVLSELASMREQPGTAVRRGLERRPRHAESDGSHVLLSSPPGRELAPAHLVAIGRIAEEFRLRPLIVGARIELCGVRPEQLRALQERLHEAGLTCGDRFLDSEARARPVRERTAARGRGASEQGWIAAPAPERGGTGTIVIGWGERGRRSSLLRGSTLRAESPA